MIQQRPHQVRTCSLAADTFGNLRHLLIASWLALKLDVVRRIAQQQHERAANERDVVNFDSSGLIAFEIRSAMGFDESSTSRLFVIASACCGTML